MDAKSLQEKLEKLLSLEERLARVEQVLYLRGLLERPTTEINVPYVSEEQRQQEAKSEEQRKAIRAGIDAIARGEAVDPALAVNLLVRQALQT